MTRFLGFIVLAAGFGWAAFWFGILPLIGAAYFLGLLP